MKVIVIKVCLLAVLCGLLVFSFIEYKNGAALKQEFSRKQADSREKVKEFKRLNDIKQRKDRIEKEEAALNEAVVAGEKVPFGLFKILLMMGEKLNFKQVALSMDDKKGAGDPLPLYFTMRFAGSFPDCMLFLRKLPGLKRIVLVEKVEIERDETLLPLLKVTLNMVTYTLNQ